MVLTDIMANEVGRKTEEVHLYQGSFWILYKANRFDTSYWGYQLIKAYRIARSVAHNLTEEVEYMQSFFSIFFYLCVQLFSSITKASINFKEHCIELNS